LQGFLQDMKQDFPNFTSSPIYFACGEPSEMMTIMVHNIQNRPWFQCRQ